MNDFTGNIDNLVPSSFEKTAILSPTHDGYDELSNHGSDAALMLQQQDMTDIDYQGLMARSTQMDDSPWQFIKGINLGGEAVVVDNRQWLSQSEATSDGLFVSPSAEIYQEFGNSDEGVDAATDTMLNSFLKDKKNISISQTLENGTYQVDLWMKEPTRTRTFDVQLEGVTVAQVKSNQKGDIQTHSFTTTVDDGSLDIVLQRVRKAPIISGIEFSAMTTDTPSDAEIGVGADSGITESVNASDSGSSTDSTDNSADVEDSPDLTDSSDVADESVNNPVDESVSDSPVQSSSLNDEPVDVLRGGDDDDVIVGNENNNILIGGEGSDRLSGGNGQDIFLYNGPWYDERTDVITDFESGVDKIDFSALLPSSTHQSNTPFTDYIRILQGENETTIQINPKGDKKSGFFRPMVILENETDIDEADFILIESESLMNSDTLNQGSTDNSSPAVDDSDDESNTDNPPPVVDDSDDESNADDESSAIDDSGDESNADDESSTVDDSSDIDEDDHLMPGHDMEDKNHMSDHSQMIMPQNGPSLDELSSFPQSANSGFRVRPNNESLNMGGKGLFRNWSDLSHFNYSDPLVNFDKPVADTHLHMFWGNNFTDETFISDAPTFNERALEVRDLLRSQPSSSANGGTANLSSYWIPAILDGDGEIQVPDHFHTYYKDGSFRNKIGPGESINDLDTLSRSQINMMPNGLRMLAGNPKATTASEQNQHVSISYSGSPSASNFKDAAVYADKGDTLQVTVVFPQCWDGKNLDSADHKSHMAYPLGRNKCPDSHPYPLPRLSYQLRFTDIPYDGFGSDFRLSSDGYNHQEEGGGFSLHGDFLEAWDEDIKREWTVEILRKGRNGLSDNVSGNKELY